MNDNQLLKISDPKLFYSFKVRPKNYVTEFVVQSKSLLKSATIPNTLTEEEGGGLELPSGQVKREDWKGQ